jgi:hypothetical protein
MNFDVNSLMPMLAGFAGGLKTALLFLAIIIVGWMVSGWVGAGVGALLRRVKFNDIASKAGISSFIQRANIKEDSSGLIGLVLKWIIRLFVISAAFNVLGLEQVSAVIARLLEWMPNLVIAMVVLVLGGWAANAVHALVRGAAKTAEADNSNMVANLARTAVWIMTAVVAINQIGIAQELVQMFFAAVVGALAIGFGLAIGLGGKDLAAEIMREWYNNSKEKGE